MYKNERNSPCREPAQQKEDFRRSQRRQEVGPTPQYIFIRETTPRWNQAPRYEDGFNGYFYLCNDFGHKVMDCRFNDRRSVGSSNNIVRCRTCHHVDHIAAYFCTMICYSCNGFGNKAQDCVNSRIQSIRGTYEPWKKNYGGRLKVKRHVLIIKDTLRYG